MSGKAKGYFRLIGSNGLCSFNFFDACKNRTATPSLIPSLPNSGCLRIHWRKTSTTTWKLAAAAAAGRPLWCEIRLGGEGEMKGEQFGMMMFEVNAYRLWWSTDIGSPLGSWARWRSYQISQPNSGLRPVGSPCTDKVFCWHFKSWVLSSWPKGEKCRFDFYFLKV